MILTALLVNVARAIGTLPVIIISDHMVIDPEVTNTGRVTFVTNVGRVALTFRTK